MDITADGDTLMRQAPATIALYLDHVIRRIDEHFGDNYAREHPDLLAALTVSCVHDLHSANLRIVGQQVRDALLEVATANVESDALASERSADALEEVAGAL